MKRARSKMGLLLVLGMLTALLPIGALTPATAAADDLVITGVVDGPLPGGLPKAVEFYVVNDIADLSEFGFGAANNGGGTDGVEFDFPADSASAGDYIYVATESILFAEFFGFAPTYTDSTAPNINGDDAIELFSNGVVSDVFGDINTDGTGEPWDHVDGWTYRVDNTGPDGASFVLANWTFSGVDALDGETTNATAAVPFPLGTYTKDVVAPPTPDLVINEVMQNPAAVNDADGEWLELYNPTSADIDIEGWTISDNDTDSHTINNGGPLVVPAGGYLVLGNNTDTATNGGAPVAYSFGAAIAVANGADELVLVDDLGTEVDRIEYDGGPVWPDPTGASMSLEDPNLDNSDGTNWCESTTAFGDGDLGTPGATNVCEVAPPTPGLVINEVMQNPAAVNDADGEWLELYNPTSADIDIEGWTISDNDTDSHTINNGGPLVVPAGGYLVLGNNTDTATNGGAPVAYSYGGNWFLSNSADEIVVTDSLGAEVDRIEYDGGPVWPDPTGASMSLEDATTDNSDGANWCESTTAFGDGDLGTPGGTNDCTPPPAIALPIYTVQGSGLASPFDGQIVAVEGVVTSDQQDGELNGFFVQDVAGDGDPATSDGIFVFEGDNAIDVNVGDVVRVQGTVDEFFDMTEITDVTSVAVIGTAPVVATSVSLPWISLDEPEQYEGMYVTIPQSLVISEYFNFDRFGEIVLTTDRAMQPTAVFDPGSPEATALTEANQLARITLDDNRTSQNPDPAIHPNGLDFTLDNLFRGGDIVANVTGVINYSFGIYRIQPTQGADYTATNPRPTAHDPVGGTLEVASFNVLNYFTTLDDGVNDICGPSGTLECRGADDAEEFERQRTKIIAAIAEINADVVGLMEIENNDAAIADLVSGLNDLMGADTYAYVDTGSIGTDAIKVAFIYKPATVSLNGAYSILDSTVDPTFNDTRNRPALAQTFTENANGESVTVVVNHLKSKGSACDDLGDPDLGDGAGNCNLTRTAAAVALGNWLADPANGFDDDVLIIGDLNSYDKEDPIDALVAAGYSDLVFDFLGENAYSYVFSGQWGYLDYAMANSALRSAVTGTTVWHINADEADLIDYDTSFKQDAQDALYEPNAYRASDHDPVIVGLQLDRTAPDVTAEFDKIWAGFFTGLFEVDFSCTDAGDPNPDCVGDINGIAVEDGQRVYLIKSFRGGPWSRQIGSILFIKDRSFTLTVTGTDQFGNTATATAEPAFRPRGGWQAN